jgi:5'-methylthioadenosine phosphorylase
MTKILDSVSGVTIGVIGGSGLYSLDSLTVLGYTHCDFIGSEYNPETPWGKPSDAIVIAETKEGVKV